MRCGKRGFKPENGSPRTLINLRQQQVRKRAVCNDMNMSGALREGENEVFLGGLAQAAEME